MENIVRVCVYLSICVCVCLRVRVCDCVPYVETLPHRSIVWEKIWLINTYNTPNEQRQHCATRAAIKRVLCECQRWSRPRQANLLRAMTNKRSKQTNNSIITKGGVGWITSFTPGALALPTMSHQTIPAAAQQNPKLKWRLGIPLRKRGCSRTWRNHAGEILGEYPFILKFIWHNLGYFWIQCISFFKKNIITALPKNWWLNVCYFIFKNSLVWRPIKRRLP